jgi:tryptophan 2,3-dioxygenase
MADNVTYSCYLDLDRILAAQHPASAAHDELLFIIVHQANELWLKLCLHELTAARQCIEGDRLRPALKMLARRCFAINPEALERDSSASYLHNSSVRTAI